MTEARAWVLTQFSWSIAKCWMRWRTNLRLVFRRPQEPVAESETLPAILRRFLVARYEGTVQRDGSESTGLFWKPAKAQTVEMDRRHLNKLSDFVAREFGYFPLNPDTRNEGYHQGRGAVREVEMVLSSRRQQLDFLGHVARKRAQRPLRAIGPVGHRRPRREDDGHAFPLERLGDLIANEPSVVKRMIFIERAFGGPRISEALNHFVTDILPGTHRPKLFPDDRPSEWPLVVLADPVNSVFTDTLQFSTEDRRQYQRRRFDMLARPDRPGGGKDRKSPALMTKFDIVVGKGRQ